MASSETGWLEGAVSLVGGREREGWVGVVYTGWEGSITPYWGDWEGRLATGGKGRGDMVIHVLAVDHRKHGNISDEL